MSEPAMLPPSRPPQDLAELLGAVRRFLLALWICECSLPHPVGRAAGTLYRMWSEMEA